MTFITLPDLRGSAATCEAPGDVLGNARVGFQFLVGKLSWVTLRLGIKQICEY